MNEQHPEQPDAVFNERRAMLAGLGGLAAGAFMARSAHAGPLAPPPGPISSTPGPEPRIAVNETNTPGGPNSLFRITEPGSYYLTGNITGVVGKHGIEIAASGVTLDLNGFDLAGVPNMGDFDGVTTSAPGLTDIEVRNGSVRNWGGNGVNLLDPLASNCRVESIRSSGNTRDGIMIGRGSLVKGSVAYRNTSQGFRTSAGCTVSECIAYKNSGGGIFVLDDCTITGCTVYENIDHGIFVNIGKSRVSGCTASDNTRDGIRVSSGSTVTGCTAHGNGLVGISAFGDCVIARNTCEGNGAGNSAGIYATDPGNRIEGNHCTDNDRGIWVNDSGNIIIRNTCRGNTVNWDIAANNKCLVINGANAPAILGNSGGTSPGSTDPNANFTY